MKQAFRYKDEKKDKFWWIDSKDTEMIVNYGKTGTSGRYQGKYFDTIEECEQTVQKLIASKKKKGYVEFNSFDFLDHLYFDDQEELGLNPMSSHPKFVAHFTSDFYYDPSEEEAPFGSDEGHDALSSLVEFIRKKGVEKIMDFPKKLIVNDWDMEFIPPTPSTVNKDSIKELLPNEKENAWALYQTDQIIVATAFGSIKTCGQITAELKELALLSLKRMSIYNELEGYGISAIHKQLATDLKSFE